MRALIPYFFVFLTAFSISGCGENHDPSQTENHIAVSSGSWRFIMDLGNKLLPFNASIQLNGSTPTFIIRNGNEKIELENVIVANDSIQAFFPIFQSEIRLRVEAPGLLSGTWINHNKKNYSIPIIGEFDKNFRFTSSKSSKNIPLRYKVVFDQQGEKPWNAVLKIKNDEGFLEGTFLTETGDYRYLVGNIMNGKVYLSTFDGSHAFYFEADIRADSLLNGIFQSGTHYETSWLGAANKNYELTPPDKLTYLNEGYEYFDFALPNQDGDTVSWNDLNLQDKVVIVDIMGSWCPNCLDANKSIQKLISNFKTSDIEVLTIAFERTEILTDAKKSVFKMQNELRANKGFLFGGKADKESASRAFPMLNHIMSYPTLIFIDKNRRIRQIYTGFYGPGTGEYYNQFMADTDSLIRVMINEPA